jgi:hypothetical protein
MRNAYDKPSVDIKIDDLYCGKCQVRRRKRLRDRNPGRHGLGPVVVVVVVVAFTFWVTILVYFVFTLLGLINFVSGFGAGWALKERCDLD